MFARIGTWQGSRDELERWISRARERVKPHGQQDPGLKVAYWLVDREGGKGLIITIWESEEAMTARQSTEAESAVSDEKLREGDRAWL